MAVKQLTGVSPLKQLAPPIDFEYRPFGQVYLPTCGEVLPNYPQWDIDLIKSFNERINGGNNE